MTLHTKCTTYTETRLHAAPRCWVYLNNCMYMANHSSYSQYTSNDGCIHCTCKYPLASPKGHA